MDFINSHLFHQITIKLKSFPVEVYVLLFLLLLLMYFTVFLPLKKKFINPLFKKVAARFKELSTNFLFKKVAVRFKESNINPSSKKVDTRGWINKFFLDKASNINPILIALIILSFPFNYKIILFFRPQDIFVISFITLNIKYIRYEYIKLVLFLFISLISSCLIGILSFDSFYYIKLAFIYKIITPILFICTLFNFFKVNN